MFLLDEILSILGCFVHFNSFLPIQLLGISAIILANLCVSYIMTSHTEEVCVCVCASMQPYMWRACVHPCMCACVQLHKEKMSLKSFY